MKFILLTFFIQSFVSYTQKPPFTFLALGDSYTVGTSEISKNSWPNQLTESLSKKGFEIESKIIAEAGWTTEKLLVEIEKAALKPNYDFVSLLIGVNNQYRGIDFESFKKDFIFLLEKSTQFAQNNPKKVIILSIPDYSVTPFARFKKREKIAKELKTYNSFIKKEAEKRNMLYVEITKVSQNAAVNPSLLASDSLHPSKKMYKIWTKKVTKKILKQVD